MRRAPIVVTATILGTAGILLFKPLETSTLASTRLSSGSDGTSASSGTDGASGSSATPSASPSASASSKASGASGTVTGEAVTTRFGTTQVKVTLKNGTITAVTAVQLNNADPRSYQISVNAEPTLRREVLSAQTAAVSTVSGATYTSLSYEASLQSALDKAGFAAADGSKASTDTPNVQEH